MIELTLQSKFKKPICLALGFFDSVHLGHRELLRRTKELAEKQQAVAVAATFSNNAYKQFNPDSKLIYTYDERLLLMEDFGITHVLPFHFNKAFKEKTKDEFWSALISGLNITGLVCGYDYLFGHGGEGDAEFLAKESAKNAITCEIIDPVKVDNVRVSSSLIKTLLTTGRIDKANKYLGAPYFMYGKVVEGRGMGHLFGIPTANISFFKDKLLVCNGVYATKTIIDSKVYKSVTNVGAKPTFEEMSISVETLIKDFDGILYGKDIKLEFYKYLRPILKFISPSELSEQVNKDMEW